VYRLAASMSKALVEKGPRALQQDAAQVFLSIYLYPS
jgi:hypothetical protein